MLKPRGRTSWPSRFPGFKLLKYFSGRRDRRAVKQALLNQDYDSIPPRGRMNLPNTWDYC